MDLTKFNFPKLSRAEIEFSNLRTDKTLLAEAKKRGFYNGRTKYNSIFSELFYKGARLNYKKKLDGAFKEAAVPYLIALMRSFEPKHEEKEAISALLLSELVE